MVITRTYATQVSVVLTVLLIGCAPRPTGPWNLDELFRAPEVLQQERLDAEGPHLLESLYYAGEPYQGRPTRVFAYLATPHKRYRPPGIVLVHGGGGTAFRAWVEMWADRGYAAIAMDLAGRGQDGQRLPDGGPDQSDKLKFQQISKGAREPWPYHAVSNVIRAHSLLRSLEGVDAGRTAITGISWGGYLTCISAGIDHRYKAAVPVYGCGYLHEDSVWTPQLNGLAPADRQAWIDHYDPSRYLAGVRMPILFINGTNDFAYPLGSYQKSYRLVKGPRTLCVTTTLEHSHPDGWAPVEIEIFIDSVLRGGDPLARIERVHRTGRRVSAAVRSKVPLRSAALSYTTDSGAWRNREWRVVPAEIQDGGRCVTAELPTEDGITWFLTVTDSRGATVSSEHECIEAITRSPWQPAVRPEPTARAPL